MMRPKRKEYGRYIVADPEICHGKLTFKGTRIMVKSVLELVAEGHDWEYISAEYDGRISRDAIAEAVEVARQALIKQTESQRRVA